MLEQVQEFRYLGLVFTPGASLGAMSGARQAGMGGLVGQVAGVGLAG